jgi:hypothetical protein
MKEDESISWSTPEYDKKDHTVDWYWTVGLVTLVAIALCIYFKDFLFGFLLFIGIGTLTFLSTRDPQTIDITITYKGSRSVTKNIHGVISRLSGLRNVRNTMVKHTSCS